MKNIKSINSSSSRETFPPCGWWSRGCHTFPQTEIPGCCCWSSWCRTCSLRATRHWLWTLAHMQSPPERDKEKLLCRTMNDLMTKLSRKMSTVHRLRLQYQAPGWCFVLARVCFVLARVCPLTTMSLKLSVLGLLLSVLWISSLWRLIPLTFTSWTSLETHSNHGNTDY